MERGPSLPGSGILQGICSGYIDIADPALAGLSSLVDWRLSLCPIHSESMMNPSDDPATETTSFP